MQLGRPDLTGPAPPAQHRPLGQAITDARTHLMHAARCTAGTILFADTVTSGGHRKAQTQLPAGKAIKLLVSDGDMQKIEKGHGRLA